jgi:hypothetical protein
LLEIVQANVRVPPEPVRRPANAEFEAKAWVLSASLPIRTSGLFGVVVGVAAPSQNATYAWVANPAAVPTENDGEPLPALFMPSFSFSIVAPAAAVIVTTHATFAVPALVVIAKFCVPVGTPDSS